MPITRSFPLPASSQDLPLPDKKPFYLVFVSSIHPETGLSWCPDVRAAMPVIDAAFEKEDAAPLGVVEVGQRPEWKEPNNVFRTKWNVHNVPCLVRFERGEDGTVKEVGRLIEEQVLEKEKLDKLLA
ncbi:hypothetical protein DM02DRAFT_335622 [Periconia macrospinosa]|uniref:Thioredoxin domain-containing protein n=1 Tax=Periconia macrospinosa TaxID=97972 RepID=A0A2V1DWW2_9PLEO|nr:hypothetical protein DM02DRAFT_335622 [Periconia macrospinosa]